MPKCTTGDTVQCNQIKRGRTSKQQNNNKQNIKTGKRNKHTGAEKTNKQTNKQRKKERKKERKKQTNKQ